MHDMPPVVDRRDCHGRIYLDYNASTPCDPRVVEEMLPYFEEVYANPSSAHGSGRSAARRLEEFRQRVANCLGVSDQEVVFTSGATESNNTVITGCALNALRSAEARRRILVSALEHKSVLNAATALRNIGFQVETIAATSSGVVDLNCLADKLGDDVLLVSVQAANNELGTLQPLELAFGMARGYGAQVHTDAAQLLGKCRTPVGALPADYVSLSGHKIYGPKGIGVLLCRRGTASAPLQPLLRGGGQELRFRAGTQNLPGIAGFARAIELIHEERDELERIQQLRDRLESSLVSRLEGAHVLGSCEARLANTSFVHVPGLNADAVVLRVSEVDVSTGSACESGAPEPSHVAQAIGLCRSEADACLRLSVGRYTTSTEVEAAIERLASTIQQVLHDSLVGPGRARLAN